MHVNYILYTEDIGLHALEPLLPLTGDMIIVDALPLGLCFIERFTYFLRKTWQHALRL